MARSTRKSYRGKAQQMSLHSEPQGAASLADLFCLSSAGSVQLPPLRHVIGSATPSQYSPDCRFSFETVHSSIPPISVSSPKNFCPPDATFAMALPLSQVRQF